MGREIIPGTRREVVTEPAQMPSAPEAPPEAEPGKAPEPPWWRIAFPAEEPAEVPA